MLHPPPLPPQRILTTCTSDVRAIPPPIVNGMPCFRSMIRAASWGCRTTTLFSRAQRPKPLSPSSPSRERAVAVVSGPGADGRLPAAGHAVGLCILFQKSSRAATATVAMPKGAHLTIGCYDHQQRTKRATRLRGAHRAAETATRYRSIAPARLDNPFPGPEQLGIWVHQHDVATEPTFSSLDAEANAQVALWAVLNRRGDIPRLLAHRLSG